MNIDELLNMLNDLKYTQRLNKPTFSELFYPDINEEDFLFAQWYLFNNDPLRYLWTLSNGQLELLCQYVNEQKYGDEQGRYQ